MFNKLLYPCDDCKLLCEQVRTPKFAASGFEQRRKEIRLKRNFCSPLDFRFKSFVFRLVTGGKFSKHVGRQVDIKISNLARKEFTYSATNFISI